MGCCFACFRVRDNRHLPTTTAATSTVSSSRPTKTNDAVVSRNRLSTLFLSEEREDSACNEGKNFGVESKRDNKGLKDEAMSVEARGTLARTLAKTPLDDQPFNTPSPCKCTEERGKRLDSIELTPSSCISNAQNTQCESLDSMERCKTGSVQNSDRTENTASVSRWPSVTYTKGMNKSVHFECETNLSSYDSFDYGAYKPPPYPTPLKLPDEMQTPGTVCSGTLDSLPNHKLQVHTLKKVPYENNSHVEESLSAWLKPASVVLEERKKRMEIAYNRIHKTPSDRPIIGMVAAHWNEDEEANVPPPKWWDGNGIPNSTNKYKEDQKVSWHATPFEERLEKALSDESFISQRKDICGKPIAFNEKEESDTAISQMQSSPYHPQSVVSF